MKYNAPVLYKYEQMYIIEQSATFILLMLFDNFWEVNSMADIKPAMITV